jgi:ribonuclease Z
MKFELTILGSNAAVPAYNRGLSAQVLNVQEQLFLIDCGEGTQFRIQEFQIRKNKIRHIFITHLHGDHIFGLAGLLTSMAMGGRTESMTIFAPFGLQEMIQCIFQYSYYKSPFLIDFQLVDHTKTGVIFENEVVKVTAFPLNHRVPCSGYLFQEQPFPKNIRPEKITAYQIPFQKIKGIKAGENFRTADGKEISNEELTLPALKPRSFAYCSDTTYFEPILETIQGVDLLYHETTFMHDMAEHAELSGHSTALQAGTIAAKAIVNQLVTGHYSSRYVDLNPILEEARSVFPNTVLGIDGQIYAVPLKR